MNKVSILVFLFLTQISFAQDLVRFPSGPASWTVTFQGVSETVPPPVQQPGLDPSANSQPQILQRIEVSQTDDLRRTVLRWTNGKSREVWSMAKTDVILTEDPTGRAFASANTQMLGDPFSPSTFNWIKPGLRASDKPIRYREMDCYHYKGSIEQFDPTEERAVSIPCEAWIDLKTLLPVALKKGEQLATFTFGPPPTSLAMPEKFRKRLDYYKLVMGLK